MSEYRRSLYKECKQALTSHQHNRLNRQLQEANRNKQRIDQFQLSRKISVSPTPRKRFPSEKENVQETQETAANISHTAKVIVTARDPEKIKKQEAFILRFLDWKDKKKSLIEKKKNEANKKKPFVSAVSKDTGFGGTAAILAPTANNQATFVPKGYHQNFEPPPGLKDPCDIVKEKVKSRQSIYTVVPTPPRKTKAADESMVKKVPVARKILTTNHPHPAREVKTKFNNKTPARSEATTKNSLSSGTKAKTTAFSSSSATKPTSTTTNAATTSAPKNLVKTLHNKNNVNEAAAKPAKPATTATTKASTNLKPRSLKMPPPPTLPAKRPIAAKPSNNTRRTEIGGGPQAKFTSAAPRRTTEGPKQQQRLNNKSPQQAKKNARLTQVMKAKKPQKPPSGASTKLLNLMVTQTNGLVSDMVIQTPKDFSSSNHFDDFVTSTKVKNASQTLEEVEGVSPIEMLSKRSVGNSSAKRNLLKEATAKAAIAAQNPIENNKPTTTENPGRKFNFIRYSEINTSITDDVQEVGDVECVVKIEEAPKEKHYSPEKESDRTLTIEAPNQEERTPTKTVVASDDKPVNYLSPYVSVSRGKVSLKKEKEKRNSIYLVNPGEDELNCSVQQQQQALSPHPSPVSSEPKSPQYSAEVRRTIEAVRYFRKQLQDEIDRLHQQCDFWEEYKLANLEKLQSANCDDMIDVTIGQTRLLTSKKFMQFKGLIDRCEARATGIGDVPNDGSEKTKDVAAVDLEGFWSMLGLQVDNLEKRFENLNRWKANDWQDPDEVKPIAKSKPKNLTKVKKTAPTAAKAKPNSALQQMLRKMQADMRNKKANNLLATTDDVILTPSKVRDRKYFSPAATVLAIPASNRRLSALLRQNSQDSPNRRMSLLVRQNSQDSPSRRMSLMVRKNSHDSPNRRTSLLARKNSHDSPNLLKSVLQFKEAFDSTIVPGEETSCGSKRSSFNVNSKQCTESPLLSSTKMQKNTDVEAAYNSPVVKSRKSILKTPGTAKSKLKNVVFNEKLRVKKFNFIVTDGGDDDADEECNKSNEEDLTDNRQDTDEEPNKENTAKLGTYTLRNRKVRLRPSCEIVIPK